MKLFSLLAVLGMTVLAHAADAVPTVTAKIVANQETPTETDLLVTITNPGEAEVTLVVDNDVGNQFDALQLKITTSDGSTVSESAAGKQIKESVTCIGSTALTSLTKGQSRGIVIPLSQYFDLPAHGAYTVTGATNDILWVGEKETRISFKATKATMVTKAAE